LFKRTNAYIPSVESIFNDSGINYHS
jgi:hypothetical protein